MKISELLIGKLLIRDKMAFNGKFSCRWPQQGGKKNRGNQKRGSFRNEMDIIEGTDSDSSYVYNI